MEDEIIMDSLWWLNVYGVDPTNYSSKKRACTVAYLTSLSISTVFVVMSLFQVDDIDGIFEAVDTFYPFMQSIMKILIISYNRKRILNIFSILKALQSVHDIRLDPKFRAKYYLARKFVYMLRNVYNSAVMLMIVKALYIGNGTFPFSAWKPHELNTIGFVIYFVILCTNGFMVIVFIGAYDSFYVSIIVHIVGQIQYFNDCLKVVFEVDNLKELVQRQNTLFDCISNVEDIFGIQLLYQLLSDSGNICLGLVIINMHGFTNINSIIHIIMVASAMAQLFLYCFFGYQVTVQLENTTFAIYDSGWWKYRKYRKDIMFMLMRANKINALTIGGIVNLDLDTYMEVVKKSFSFYALLNAQREEG